MLDNLLGFLTTPLFSCQNLTGLTTSLSYCFLPLA